MNIPPSITGPEANSMCVDTDRDTPTTLNSSLFFTASAVIMYARFQQNFLWPITSGLPRFNVALETVANVPLDTEQLFLDERLLAVTDFP